MDLSKIRELIEQARGVAKNDEFRQLIDHFEGFVDLFGERDAHKGDVEFVKKLIERQGQFWASFGKVAEGFGLTPELMKQYFESPVNFTPQQWQEMETLKKEIFNDEPKEKAKKTKKSKGKVRI